MPQTICHVPIFATVSMDGIPLSYFRPGTDENASRGLSYSTRLDPPESHLLYSAPKEEDSNWSISLRSPYSSHVIFQSGRKNVIFPRRAKEVLCMTLKITAPLTAHQFYPSLRERCLPIIGELPNISLSYQLLPTWIQKKPMLYHTPEWLPKLRHPECLTSLFLLIRLSDITKDSERVF